MTKNSEITEIALNLSTLLYFLSLHSIAPYISRYAIHLGASEQEVAFLGPALSVVAISIRPLSGLLIDRGLLRVLLVVGVSLAIAAQTSYWLSTSTIFIYLGRALQGIGVALFIPASIYTATLVRRNIASSLAWRSTMIGLSMVLGPAVGGVLVSLYGYRSLFTAAGLYLLLSGFITVAAVRELKPSTKGENAQLLDILNLDYLVASFSILTYSIVYNCFLLFLPAYHSLLKVDVVVTTSLFTTLSIANFTSRVALSLLSSRLKYPLIALLGSILALSGMSLIVLNPVSPYLPLYAVIAGFGGGLLIPSLQIIALLNVRERSRGLASGTYTAMFDVGNIVGPPLAVAIGRTYLDSLKASIAFSTSGPAILLVYNAILLFSKNGVKLRGK
ncbi:MAG: MFS transporter [Sulfolobales archaeon]|nr:MFS transporter [Sulfolobales archaeon]MDW8083169.1 MFS transporter [Sulfolobales archaeon]